MDISVPGQSEGMVFQVFGKAQQDAHGQLVVQEPALEIAGGSAPGPGVKAHDVPGLNAQFPGFLCGLHILVQHHLHRIKAALYVGIAAVNMDGGVAQLQRAFIACPFPGVDPDVFRLAVVGVHATQRGQPQPPVPLYLGNHGPQGVGVGFQQKPLSFPAAQVRQNAALDGQLRREAQGLECVPHPGSRLFRIARGRVNGQKRRRLLPGKIRVRMVKHCDSSDYE